jgi:hypothetical protein
VAHGSQVTADLVHTAGTEFQLQAGKFPGSDTTVTSIGFPLNPADFEIRFYGSAWWFRTACAEDHVLFPDAEGRGGVFPAGKDAGKKGCGGFTFGHQDDTGCVLVQAVYQQGPGEVFNGQEGIKGRPHPFPALYRKAGRLIQDYTLSILKEYGNIFHTKFPIIPIIIIS